METSPCQEFDEHQVVTSSIAHRPGCKNIVNRNHGAPIEYLNNLDKVTP